MSLCELPCNDNELVKHETIKQANLMHNVIGQL